MATKAVILARKNGDAAELALPYTSADLTAYHNPDAPEVEHVAGALDNLFAKSPGDIAALGARVDALETGVAGAQSAADTAGEAAADWTASKPGIVRRVEALEAMTPADIGALPADGKAVSAGTADSATRWNGSCLTISAAAPAGGADNDVWFQYV